MIQTFEGIPLLITTALQFFLSHLREKKTWVHDLHMASVELGFIPAIAMFSNFWSLVAKFAAIP